MKSTKFNKLDKPNKLDKLDKPNKLDSDTALAKIKVLVGDYYEGLGREDYENDYNVETDLIEKIDEVIINSNINTRNVIIEKLELDKLKGGIKNE